jgi:AraC-like DNA-binding protein
MNVNRLLHCSDGWSVHDVRCSARAEGCGGEEHAAAAELVLPRRGLFVRHRGPRADVADPGRCLFFRRGEPYRVSHPIDGGDACTVLSFEGDRGFARAHAPTSPQVELLHRRLLRALQDGPGERLAQAEALHVLGEALLALAGAQDRSRADLRERRSDASRRGLARAAQVRVAVRYRESIALGVLARELGCSPFHLSRTFRGEIGVPLHKYQTRLRLRAALGALLEGASDLTALALELGFFDHAHFTRAFRREFGRAPSSCRTRVDARELRELSKIVQARLAAGN